MSKQRVTVQAGQIVALAVHDDDDDSKHPSSTTFRARFIRSGRIVTGSGKPGRIIIAEDALRSAANQFDEIPMFVDHSGFFEGPSLHNMAAVITRAEWREDRATIEGEFRTYPTPAGRLMADLFLEMLSSDESPNIGLSAVFWVENSEATKTDGDETVTITSIGKVESVDFVFSPAADGRVLTALSALNQLPPEETIMSKKTDKKKKPTAVEPVVERGIVSAYTLPATAASPGEPAATPGIVAVAADPTAPAPIAANGTVDGSAPAAAATPVAAPAATAVIPAVPPTAAVPPEPARALVNTDLLNRLQRLEEAAAINIGSQAPRGAGIQMGQTGFEEVQKALTALIQGQRPPAGVRPLTGIREFYMLMSGDYEMTGMFDPTRVQFATVNSATMAGLVANALNKVVINMFQEYPQWWRRLVTSVDFTTLQDARWISLGGVGELPNVSEGAAYTELTWDDQTETDPFVKKGGYLGITLEAIDKDDTGRLQAAPRALAQAAWMTLSKTIAEIFTTGSGVGPAMSDAVVLFHADHNNLLTTALSYTAWDAVRIAMMKQAELSSSERLGFLTRPKFLIVPIDLEQTALEILGSRNNPSEGSTTSFEAINQEADAEGQRARLALARSRVVVVPFWTDTNNWAAAADPMLYPSLGVGYRYGRTPEVFSVASPTAGLMFSNDTMPIKVRFFFAVGPTDWRGLHKNNVS